MKVVVDEEEEYENEEEVIFAESLEVLVMALEALHEEAKPLRLEVSRLKINVKNLQLRSSRQNPRGSPGTSLAPSRPPHTLPAILASSNVLLLSRRYVSLPTSVSRASSGQAGNWKRWRRVLGDVLASSSRCCPHEVLWGSGRTVAHANVPSSVALQAVAHANVPSSVAVAIYYTDGSVDPERGRTGAAVVTGGEVLSWRTPDHCSTLQTELVAIERALQHALGRQEEVVVIHTDSMSALQVLRQPRTPMDNVQLTTAIMGHIQGLAAQGRCVRFNWVPSHIGVRGNEAADEAAREATRHPAVALTSLPSIQGAKVLARRAAICAADQQYRQLVQTSRQAAWHKQATNNNEPLRPAQQLSRAEEVVLHRLRLGYVTLDELRDGFEERPCEHCPHMIPHPLIHYLLPCPATERLRQRVGPESAAALVWQFQKNLHLLLEVARAAPPPQ
ncbi:hypothetical protein GWK47_018369 [Chionoecetes opilio]|uniref:ribonuclease H n=1 Tax=Chionoecetes opilio TaxID=41210 RepID=A0A8J4XR16_CHIOP|nr:hypothetical protein GWK47_018369 [Chionoecetes opilio]